VSAGKHPRKWYSPLGSLLAPGIGEIREGRRIGWLPFGLLLSSVGVLLTVSGRGVALLADARDLLVVIAAACTLSAAMLTGALVRASKSGRGVIGRCVGGTLASLLALLPAAGTYWFVEPQIRLLDEVFIEESSPVRPHAPVKVPSAPTGPVDLNALADWQDRIENTPVEGRTNILLLGGDAGPGRWSLRTDSINLVSLDPSSGDIAMIGLPRNLQQAPMPPGFESIFPDGFDDLLNAVYTWGTANPDKVEEVLGAGEEPGARLISAVVEELTGEHVDAFVLVDMQGFIEVVDALGGVTVYVPKDLTAPGNVPGGKHPVTDMTEGWNHLDGTDALSFSRARSDDSDYWRMGRQRCLLANLAAQNPPQRVLSNWRALSQAIRENVSTNLDPAKLLGLIQSTRSLNGSSRSLALTPPTVPSRNWDLDTIRRLVQETIHPGGIDRVQTTTGEAPGDPAVATTVTEKQVAATKAVKQLNEECKILG